MIYFQSVDDVASLKSVFKREREMKKMRHTVSAFISSKRCSLTYMITSEIRSFPGTVDVDSGFFACSLFISVSMEKRFDITESRFSYLPP